MTQVQVLDKFGGQGCFSTYIKNIDLKCCQVNSTIYVQYIHESSETQCRARIFALTQTLKLKTWAREGFLFEIFLFQGSIELFSSRVEFLLNLIKFCNLMITLLTSHTLSDHFSENDLEPGDGYEFVMIKIILSFISSLQNMYLFKFLQEYIY